MADTDCSKVQSKMEGWRAAFWVLFVVAVVILILLVIYTAEFVKVKRGLIAFVNEIRTKDPNLADALNQTGVKVPVSIKAIAQTPPQRQGMLVRLFKSMAAEKKVAQQEPVVQQPAAGGWWGWWPWGKKQ